MCFRIFWIFLYPEDDADLFRKGNPVSLWPGPTNIIIYEDLLITFVVMAMGKSLKDIENRTLEIQDLLYPEYDVDLSQNLIRSPFGLALNIVVTHNFVF